MHPPKTDTHINQCQLINVVCEASQILLDRDLLETCLICGCIQLPRVLLSVFSTDVCIQLLFSQGCTQLKCIQLLFSQGCVFNYHDSDVVSMIPRCVLVSKPQSLGAYSKKSLFIVRLRCFALQVIV